MGAICVDISFMFCFLICAISGRHWKIGPQNNNAVVRRKQNIIFLTNGLYTACHKKQTDCSLTNLLFSPLLFVLVFLFVFFPVLVWAAVAVLQLLFVSVFLLRVVLVFAGTPEATEVRDPVQEVRRGPGAQGHKRCHRQSNKPPAI